MHNLPKVSVCFLTYNSERDNLKESLKNLLKLKYKNIQFIISDDNSTDKSFEICKEVKKKSKKIIFLNKNKQNLGSWMNYYKAINLSKGDYVFWACPNDFYAKNFVSESVNKLIKKDKFVACGTTVYDINEKGHVLQKRDYKGEKLPDKLSLFNLISMFLVRKRKINPLLYPSYGSLIHSLNKKDTLLKVINSYIKTGPIINERVINSSMALMGDITYSTKTSLKKTIHKQDYLERKSNDPNILSAMSKINFLKVSYKFFVSTIFLPIGFKRLIIFPVIWRIIINSLIHLTLNFITKVLLKLLPNRLYAYLKKLYRNFYPEYEEYDEYKRKINLKIKK